MSCQKGDSRQNFDGPSAQVPASPTPEGVYSDVMIEVLAEDHFEHANEEMLIQKATYGLV